MARVFGIHIVELREGITPEYFEAFVVEQFLPALPLHRTPGVTARLLRADRGDRSGRYLWMFEFDSVETRDRYFPEQNRISEETAALIAPLQDLAQTWDAASSRTKTDYIVIAENCEGSERRELAAS